MLDLSARNGLLIVVGLAIVAARMAHVQSSTGETPFLSANDRSRWAAMSALVDEGKASTDTPQEYRDPYTKRATLQSIDRVMHVGKDGVLHSYSSKPPLLVAGYACFYWLVNQLTGETVYSNPLLVGRWTLALAHLMPLAIYWWLIFKLIDRWSKDDSTRLVLAITAVFGTHLTPFALSVNNHLPGAIAAMLTLLGTLRCLHSNERWFTYAGTGLAAGIGVICELPALAWALMVGLLLLWHAPRPAIFAYGGAFAFVAGAFLLTNFWVHGSVRPPYMHRGLGKQIGLLPSASEAAKAIKLPQLLVEPDRSIEDGPDQQSLLQWSKQFASSNDSATVVPSGRSPHWELRFRDATTQAITNRVALIANPAGDWRLYAWDDWYDYPGSYWVKGKPSGVDQGEPDRAVYAFHALVGHHGVFSLTPIWLFSLLSFFCWRLSERQSREGQAPFRIDSDKSGRVAWGICLVTFVCMAFYVLRPEHDRNYGGVSCCFRWVLWLVPLWLWLAIGSLDWIFGVLKSTRLAAIARFAVYLALAISVFSAFSAFDNPWQHPWIYRYWQYLGWIVG